MTQTHQCPEPPLAGILLPEAHRKRQYKSTQIRGMQQKTRFSFLPCRERQPRKLNNRNSNIKVAEGRCNAGAMLPGRYAPAATLAAPNRSQQSPPARCAAPRLEAPSPALHPWRPVQPYHIRLCLMISESERPLPRCSCKTALPTCAIASSRSGDETRRFSPFSCSTPGNGDVPTWQPPAGQTRPGLIKTHSETSIR